MDGYIELISMPTAEDTAVCKLEPINGPHISDIFGKSVLDFREHVHDSDFDFKIYCADRFYLNVLGEKFLIVCNTASWEYGRMMFWICKRLKMLVTEDIMNNHSYSTIGKYVIHYELKE